MRALEGVLGLCGELATAASRWRPARVLLDAAARMARPGEAQRDGKGGGAAPGRRVGASATEKGGRETSPRRRRRRRQWAAAKQSRGGEEGDKGRLVITKNSRDLSVNKQ